MVILAISANENTLWTLAAMLDFKSAPKHISGRGPSNEHFWLVWFNSVQKTCESFADRKFKMAATTRLSFNIGPYGKNV
jgi:hypothetical protein